jgi:glucan phosphoethanolaminetransferase (alkaline phosphatase superfamily)
MSWDSMQDYMNSFLGVLFLLLGTILIPEIRQTKKYWITISILALIMLLLGFAKIKRDNKKDSIYQSNTDSLKKKIENLDSSLKDANTYLHRLDSVGIKRDTAKNMPTVTKTFINNIEKVNTMNQY